MDARTLRFRPGYVRSLWADSTRFCDAWLVRLGLLVLLAVLLGGGLTRRGHAASARTQNFIVNAANQQLAQEIAKAAEQYRRDLAMEWLGHELPAWQRPCPIVAHVDASLGAGGRTSFSFHQRTPFGWEMEVQGSSERILDSVLPHEVTHTIFATHFGRPLPRWADEGACTTVEHRSERRKQELWLLEFLKTERGIPFNRMFAMTDYPSDIMPLYSQGYSVARYLIAQGGKTKFVEFVGQGLDTGDWPTAVRRYYGYDSLGDLQLSWVDWVGDGSRAGDAGSYAGTRLVSSETSESSGDGRVRLAALQRRETSSPAQTATSWYARREQTPSEGSQQQQAKAVADANAEDPGTSDKRRGLPINGWRSRSF